MLTFKSNNYNRPYDDYLSYPALQKALALRQNPTGLVQALRYEVRAGVHVPIYPWPKMELGDMFFAPIGSRSLKAMRVGFQQMASKHDFEICIIRINDSYGVDCLRVSVTAIGINVAKLKAYDDGRILVAPNSGRHAEARLSKTKARRAKAEKKRRGAIGYVPRKRKADGFVAGDKRTDPFWADSRHPPKPPAATTVVDNSDLSGIHTDASMSRAEKVRLALKRASGG